MAKVSIPSGDTAHISANGGVKIGHNAKTRACLTRAKFSLTQLALFSCVKAVPRDIHISSSEAPGLPPLGLPHPALFHTLGLVQHWRWFITMEILGVIDVPLWLLMLLTLAVLYYL